MRFLLLIIILIASFKYKAYAVPDEGILLKSEDKINLALRRTADKLLYASGDSTSRIPAIEKISEDTWRIQLNQSFKYDSLPKYLHASLKLHAINLTYDVIIRNCIDNVIDLGFNHLDYKDKSRVPCGNRELDMACRMIDVKFKIALPYKTSFNSTYLLFGLFIPFAFLFYRKRNDLFSSKNDNHSVNDISSDNYENNLNEESTSAKEFLNFGNSKLDVKGQVLHCGGEHENLTYREAKLLSLFANNLNELLNRSDIIEKVWADEGVMVGRSVDVFVSRLRKKLKGDESISIVGVHGIGYKMESKIEGWN